uniref:Nucleic-acid-binding protein from transposon X-element n=1 Tax=Caenorhabditis tropicalis TaxID=1561998 RepID=A0A1I7V4K7_9PELO
MAVTWQLKTITDQANRQMRRPPPREQICGFCRQAHSTTSCNNVPRNDKMKIAKAKKICILCCGRANHHPVKCNALRQRVQLCTKRECGLKYGIHHESMCKHGGNPPSSLPVGYATPKGMEHTIQDNDIDELIDEHCDQLSQNI